MNLPIYNKHGEKLDYTFHEAEKKHRLVILGHGVTANKDRDMIENLANDLAKAGWPCLRFSFAGNGNSDGEFTACTISKEVDDLTSVIDQLAGGASIAYCGHSMGGAVGTLAAARDERIAVLVSMAGMARTKVFFETEFSDQEIDKGFLWGKPDCPLSKAFADDLCQIDNTIAAAKEVRVPWLLVHGTDDDTVLFSDSEENFAAAKCVKKLVPVSNTNHMFEENPQALTKAIVDWLGEHFA